MTWRVAKAGLSQRDGSMIFYRMQRTRQRTHALRVYELVAGVAGRVARAAAGAGKVGAAHVRAVADWAAVYRQWNPEPISLCKAADCAECITRSVRVHVVPSPT